MLHDPVFSLEIILDVDIYGQTGFFMDNCGQIVDVSGHWFRLDNPGIVWTLLAKFWTQLVNYRGKAPFLSILALAR